MIFDKNVERGWSQIVHSRVLHVGLATAAVACREQAVEDSATILQGFRRGRSDPLMRINWARIEVTRSIQDVARRKDESHTLQNCARREKGAREAQECKTEEQREITTKT
jgi:hypothetical protein